MNDLGELFHRLRDEELSRVPSLRLGGESVPQRWMRGWAIAVVLFIAIVLSIAHHHRRPPVTESILAWKAPTDFLLRTPGSELLSTIPRIPERR